MQGKGPRHAAFPSFRSSVLRGARAACAMLVILAGAAFAQNTTPSSSRECLAEVQILEPAGDSYCKWSIERDDLSD